jgi:hypothetical protein
VQVVEDATAVALELEDLNAPGLGGVRQAPRTGHRRPDVNEILRDRVSYVEMSGVRRMRKLLYLVAVAGIAACGGEPADHFTLRDSAGIAVAESHGQAWTPEAAWSIAAEPILRIGTVEGPPEDQLHDVQGAVRLDDGTLVIANAGSNEIRFYDNLGRHIRSVGRDGDAPGEYRRISGLGAGPGDSLWVYDYGTRRFTVLTARGDVVRLVTLGATLSAPNAVGRLADGSFIIKEQWASSLQGEWQPGLTRGTTAVTRLLADGSAFDTLATVLGREVFLSDENGRAVMGAPLFARASSATVSGNDVYLGNQTTFEILRYSADGDLRRIIRVPNADLSITQEEVDLVIARELASVPESRHPMVRTHLESMAMPPTRPAYGRLHVDQDGNLWTAEPTRYPYPARSWTVFDTDGRLLGVVTMPESLRLQQAGSDWVLGVWRDELGVEYVSLHTLHKAP